MQGADVECAAKVLIGGRRWVLTLSDVTMMHWPIASLFVFPRWRKGSLYRLELADAKKPRLASVYVTCNGPD